MTAPVATLSLASFPGSPNLFNVENIRGAWKRGYYNITIELTAASVHFATLATVSSDCPSPVERKK